MPLPEARPDWQYFPDAGAVATAAAALILSAADAAIAARGEFRLVLAGGTTPDKVYRQLAASPVDWTRWQIYFGDERCLPVTDPGRNSRMAAEAWLDQCSIPRDNVHPIPAELGSQAAAQLYAPQVAAARPFDLVLLGMGEDGHTASLFPGQVHPNGEQVHAVSDAPKPPPDRVTLSREALSDSRDVLILVTGAGKRTAVRRWLAGEDLPIARITARQHLRVLTDRAACGGCVPAIPGSNCR
ncbi:MAG: 6-phosphogluconolactonase [Gammaproteobacteria bacterium]|jgi:6-phosphogluconolactonase